MTRRRVRAFGGRMLRRLGAVPGGAPDGLGDDAKLLGGRIAQRVVVFFPETPTNLYQLRQWYDALAALDERHPVAVVAQDSRVARAVRAETAFPVLCIARSATLDDLLSRSDVRLMLYVSHHPANFQALRTLGVAHVYLTHGDSDKLVSVTNQIKAYDFTLVAGQAAIDRAASVMAWFDAADRMIPVGRPQLDALAAPVPPAHTRPTVLYAPTWEGAQPSTSYSSLQAAGPRIVASLIASGDVRVVYRPHPRTGARDAAFADVDRAVRATVLAGAGRDPDAGHRVDTSPSPIPAMAGADLLLCDVSAMAQDWLPTGRPLILTEPPETSAVVTDSRLSDAVTRLRADDADRTAQLVTTELRDDPHREARRELTRYYLGDVTPGAATARFVAACDDLVSRRDAAVATLSRR